MNSLILLLGGYLIFILALGIHGALRVRRPADFWIAGGRISALSAGGSLVATIVGGSGTLGLAGLAYRRGLSGSWWLLVGAVGLTALLFLVKNLKRHSVYTLPELIGVWYGPLMAKVAALFVVVAWLGIVGAQSSAAGRILRTFFGGDVRVWTLAAGAVFIAYTASGGQVSVIRTDLLQALFISLGIGISAAAGLKLCGGWSALSSALPPSYLSFPLSSNFSGLDLTLMLLVVGSTYLIGPDILSRVFSSRSTKSARGAVLIAIGAIVPLALLVTLTGMASRVLFPGIPAEAALPTLARQALPPWLGALTMIALLSAFLSSADTTLLTMSAVVTVNLLGKRDSGPRPLLVPRLCVVGCGVAALVVAMYTGGIIPSLLLGYTIFAGGLFIPILAGLMGLPLRRAAALTAAGLGGLCALTGKLIESDLLIACSFAAGAAVYALDRIPAGISGKKF